MNHTSHDTTVIAFPEHVANIQVVLDSFYNPGKDRREEGVKDGLKEESKEGGKE
jgi:hypothetical protein